MCTREGVCMCVNVCVSTSSSSSSRTTWRHPRSCIVATSHVDILRLANFRHLDNLVPCAHNSGRHEVDIALNVDLVLRVRGTHYYDPRPDARRFHARRRPTCARWDRF